MARLTIANLAFLQLLCVGVVCCLTNQEFYSMVEKHGSVSEIMVDDTLPDDVIIIPGGADDEVDDHYILQMLGFIPYQSDDECSILGIADEDSVDETLTDVDKYCHYRQYLINGPQDFLDSIDLDPFYNHNENHNSNNNHNENHNSNNNHNENHNSNNNHNENHNSNNNHNENHNSNNNHNENHNSNNNHNENHNSNNNHNENHNSNNNHNENHNSNNNHNENHNSNNNHNENHNSNNNHNENHNSNNNHNENHNSNNNHNENHNHNAKCHKDKVWCKCWGKKCKCCLEKMVRFNHCPFKTVFKLNACLVIRYKKRKSCDPIPRPTKKPNPETTENPNPETTEAPGPVTTPATTTTTRCPCRRTTTELTPSPGEVGKRRCKPKCRQNVYDIKFTINGKTFREKDVTLKDLEPICYNLGRKGGHGRVCLKFYNVRARRHRVCSRLTAVWKTNGRREKKLNLDIGCMKLYSPRTILTDIMTGGGSVHEMTIDSFEESMI